MSVKPTAPPPNHPHKPLQIPLQIPLPKSGKETPASAPSVPEMDQATKAPAMQALVRLTHRKPSRLWRMFWGLLVSLILMMLSLSAWDFVAALLGRNAWLGGIAFGLSALLALSAVLLATREWLAYLRFARMDRLRRDFAAARASGKLTAARKQMARLLHLYRHREDLSWARQDLLQKSGDIVEAEALLALTEQVLMQPLDAAASREIEAAARQVATITAIVPLALADLATALFANLRMVRRIAEIYGGRAGTLGSWRLLKTVMLHLVATGALSVGDDLIGTLAGGGLLSKLSRRFGEGVVNGALTARVGVAAMEICRPMTFEACKRPGVSEVVQRALAGLFSKR